MNPFVEKLHAIKKWRTAIFIDASNLESSVRSMFVNDKDVTDEFRNVVSADLSWRVDYRAMKDFFESIFSVGYIGFYSPRFETELQDKFFSFLKWELWFKIKTKLLKIYLDHTEENPHRKANFDVEMAVDMTDMYDDFDICILFSGDCDFEYLIKFLRGKGKIVIVFSKKGNVAKEIPSASSHYFDIIDFRDIFLRIAKKTKSPTKR